MKNEDKRNKLYKIENNILEKDMMSIINTLIVLKTKLKIYIIGN